MESLSRIACFVRSAESSSFSAAARKLGLSPAAVSKSVAKLESELGVRLFQRTTRSLTLTEDGARFLRDAGGGLATLEAAVANLASHAGQPAGTLKVSLSPGFGRAWIVPLLVGFLRRYPAVVPDWRFDNRAVDLVADGFDAAIGGGLELSPGVVARELARVHVVAVASPAYVGRVGAPKTPSELARHEGVAMRSAESGRLRVWTLRDREGHEATVEPKARLIFDDPEAIAEAARLGLGVALLALPHALADLKSGALVRLLPRWHADAGPISLYFAGHRGMPPKTRAFVDFVVEHFRRHGLAKRLSAGAR